MSIDIGDVMYFVNSVSFIVVGIEDGKDDECFGYRRRFGLA